MIYLHYALYAPSYVCDIIMQCNAIFFQYSISKPTANAMGQVSSIRY